jgi:hypothetical protein
MRSAADASETWTQASRTRAGAPSLATTALVLIAVLAMGGFVVLSGAEGLLAWDVRFAYLPAAEAVLDGRSPYPALDDPLLEEQKGYVYPPQLLFALMPLTPLPTSVAAALVAGAMIAMLLLTLWVLGVRDVRCYAAVLLWMPAISGVMFSNTSIPIALALALAWRYRDHVWQPGIAVGVSVSAKLLSWPIVVWMLATRRLRAAVCALLVGSALTLGAWAAIGFDGLVGYPDLLQRLSDIQSERSYSLVGIASTLGLGAAGKAVALVVGGALIVWCVVLGRRGEDLRSFTCAVAAMLALSPIVWLHYLIALLVPLAVARPRFTWLWVLPVALWVSPRPGYAEGYEAVAPALVATIMFVFLLSDRARRASVAVAST